MTPLRGFKLMVLFTLALLLGALLLLACRSMPDVHSTDTPEFTEAEKAGTVKKSADGRDCIWLYSKDAVHCEGDPL